MIPAWGTAALALVLVLAGCVRGGYAPPGARPTGDRGQRDAGRALDVTTREAPGQDASSRCDATARQCHPSGNGTQCLQGTWQVPPCVSIAGGCGATLDASVGFCDPRWSGCVGPGSKSSSCTEYCTSIGKTCKESCITSRGYPNRGAEAWQTGASCVDPAAMGAGQTDCAFTWDLTEARWRCCCL